MTPSRYVFLRCTLHHIPATVSSFIQCFDVAGRSCCFSANMRDILLLCRLQVPAVKASCLASQTAISRMIRRPAATPGMTTTTVAAMPIVHGAQLREPHGAGTAAVSCLRQTCAHLCFSPQHLQLYSYRTARDAVHTRAQIQTLTSHSSVCRLKFRHIFSLYV